MKNIKEFVIEQLTTKPFGGLVGITIILIVAVLMMLNVI